LTNGWKKLGDLHIRRIVGTGLACCAISMSTTGSAVWEARASECKGVFVCAGLLLAAAL